MVSEPKYPHPHFFAALAKRVAATTDVPDEMKKLVASGASSLLASDCTRAIESLRFLPKHIYENLFAVALKDVGDDRRLDQFFERTVGVSPNVPPDATRH